MKRIRLPQEALKLIACIAMLTDHIGAVFVGRTALRVIGRLAMPIYCFLLAEGICHTKHPVRYGTRLFLGMVFAELPFDCLFYGRFTLQHQSVMVTLFLAYCMGQCILRLRSQAAKVLVCIPFVLAAELLMTDYGGVGVLFVAMFLLTRELPGRLIVQTLALALLCLSLNSRTVYGIPLQLFAVAAMVPIGLYSGRKLSSSRAAQTAFYLFYPGHLAVLWLVRFLI